MPSIEGLLHARQERIDQLHRLQPGQTALVVIDMQRGFLDPGAALEVPQGRAIVPNLQRLVEACRGRRVPVIFTEFVYAATVPCLRGDPFGPEHLPAVEGQPTGFCRPSSNCLWHDLESRPASAARQVEPGVNSAEIVPALAPRPDELVVRGHTYDKFLGTPLDLALRSRGIRYLILTGVVTDLCVNSTLMTAANLDYRVTAVTDGVATLWPDIQQACFHIWRRKFARLRTTDQVVAEIVAFGA